MISTMKFSIKTSIALAALVMACAEPDAPTPAPSNNLSYYTAEFSFINAVADAPANGLDFYVNNNKIGDTKAFLEGVPHTVVQITTNGVGANTNLRVKSAGGIGGVLGTNDLIYRAGNNNNNNFVASASISTTTLNTIRYTLVALDSTTRPAPLRKLNAANFGDTTFFQKLTGNYISTVDRALLDAAGKAALAPIGTVPLGSTDPGGPRFALLTDTYPAAVLTSATQAAFRVIQTSPNAPGLFVRLKFVSGTGADITLTGAAVGYIMGFLTPTQTANFSPSVGSRSTTVAFGAQTVVAAGVPNVYNIEVATDAAFTNVVASKAGAPPRPRASRQGHR